MKLEKLVRDNENSLLTFSLFRKKKKKKHCPLQEYVSFCYQVKLTQIIENKNRKCVYKINCP
jgi:hypothetical protein